MSGLQGKIASRAGRGLSAWLWQRGTAAVMSVGIPCFALYVWLAPIDDHSAWRSLFAPLPVRIALLLLGLCVLIHAWIGVRDVLMDYVRAAELRFVLYGLILLALAAQGVWLVDILWGL